MEISLEQRIHVVFFNDMTGYGSCLYLNEENAISAALEIAEGNGIDRETAREMLDDQGSILQGDCQIHLDTSFIEDIATGEMI